MDHKKKREPEPRDKPLGERAPCKKKSLSQSSFDQDNRLTNSLEPRDHSREQAQPTKLWFSTKKKDIREKKTGKNQEKTRKKPNKNEVFATHFTAQHSTARQISFAFLCSGAAVAYALHLAKGVMAQPAGNSKMQEIALAIQEGSSAFLKREYKLLSVFVAAVAILLTVVNQDPMTAMCFVSGALVSAVTGWLGGSGALCAAESSSFGQRQGALRAPA